MSQYHYFEDRFKFTKHALKRMVERDVTEEEVITAFNLGYDLVRRQEHKNAEIARYGVGFHRRRYKCPNTYRDLVVIYKNVNKQKHIITVYLRKK